MSSSGLAHSWVLHRDTFQSNTFPTIQSPPPPPLGACGVHGDVHDAVWAEPLEEEQEEEVKDGHEGEDGAGHGATVRPQPEQPSVQGKDLLSHHLVIDLGERRQPFSLMQSPSQSHWREREAFKQHRRKLSLPLAKRRSPVYILNTSNQTKSNVFV